MEKSIELAIERIHNRLENRDLRGILLEFYKARTVEILGHLDEQGVGEVIDYDNLKLGGTI